MKLLYIFLIIPLFCLTTDATAQVTLSTQTKMVAPNAEVTIELRATTRDSLSSLQFSFSWNAAVLAFQRLDTIGGFPPSAESSEFGLSSATAGKLSFLWIDGSSRGYRVATDSFVVFKIVFKAIGANGTNTALQFLSTPTLIKASNANLVAIAVTSREGSVKVGTTAVFSTNTEGSPLGQNFPNPVINQTTIPVFMTEAADVNFDVTNLIGEKFLMRKYHFEAGRHEIRLNTEGVLSSGIYMYNIRTNQGVVSRILIKN